MSEANDARIAEMQAHIQDLRDQLTKKDAELQYNIDARRDLTMELQNFNSSSSNKTRRVVQLEKANDQLRNQVDCLRQLVLHVTAHQFVKLAILKKNLKGGVARLRRIAPDINDDVDPSILPLSSSSSSSSAAAAAGSVELRFHGPGKTLLTRFSDVNKKHRKFRLTQHGEQSHDAKRDVPLLAAAGKAKVDVQKRFGRYWKNSMASTVDALVNESIRLEPYVNELRNQVTHWRKTSDTFFARVIDLTNAHQETSLALQKANTRVSTLKSLMKVHDEHYRQILKDKGVSLDADGNVIEAHGLNETKGSVIRAQKMKGARGWGYMSNAQLTALGRGAVNASARRAEKEEEENKLAEIKSNSDMHVKNTRISILKERERTLTSRVASLENQHRHLLTHSEILPDVVPSRLGDSQDLLIPKQLHSKFQKNPSGPADPSQGKPDDVAAAESKQEPAARERSAAKDKDSNSVSQADQEETKNTVSPDEQQQQNKQDTQQQEELESLSRTQGRLKLTDIEGYCDTSPSLFVSMREATGETAKATRPKSTVAKRNTKRAATGLKRPRGVRSARGPARSATGQEERKIRDALVNDVYVTVKKSYKVSATASRTARLRNKTGARAVPMGERNDGQIQSGLAAWKPTKEFLVDPDELDRWYESLKKEENDDIAFLSSQYGLDRQTK